MKRRIVKILLAALNSRWLNKSPCNYGFIGNVDAFSYANLRSEDNQQPGITVREVLATADAFRSCPIKAHGLTLIEADGSYRTAGPMDLHQLRVSITPQQPKSPESPSTEERAQ